MKIFNLKKIFWLIFLATAFSFQFALAETAIPENLAPLANELGCQTKEECVKAFDSNFEKGIELAEKYQIYSKEQSDIAKSYKQEVISKLSGLSEENFEEEIVKIAKELLKKPKLAQSFQLDKESVSAAETIVAEVKNAGVDVDICSQAADTLSREQLIGCLEASKKLAKKSSIVQKYIPKGVIEKTNMADMAASLDEALARGDYPELGKTAEEAGQKCLKSGSESLKSCDEIAQKFFGPEGVKELASARAQTKQAGDFYLKNLENMELITPDGKKITGKMTIKNTCDQAFETRDVKMARACGDFAVKNGFTGKEEMENSLKLFESMADKNINFDECRSNPEICEEFIPEEHKQEFEGNKKIYEIMKSEAGFNPIECERGNVDFEIGRKCFEASKKALPKLKEIAKDYPDVQRMVAEIEFGIKRETEQSQRGDDFGKFFSQQAGPGGCKNEKECFAYCNDPAHGAECISFGAKHEVFQGNEAVERYQRYNDILTNPSPDVYNQPRQDGYYGDSRYNQGRPGGQTYPYPASDNRGPYVNQGGFGGPAGPSPECFAAIQSGDFAKAKEICSIPTNPYQYQQQAPYQSYPDDRYRSDRPCPAVAPAQCPEGQYREQRFTDNCPVYGQCLPISNYRSSSPVNRICPAIPEYDCQSGYQKIYRTTPDGCGVSECVPVSNSSYPSYDEKEKCYRGGGFWTGNYCDYQNRSSASYSSYGNANYSSYGYAGSCSSGLLNLLGSGCHYMYNDNSGNRIYCNSEMTKSAKYGDTATTEGCSSGGGNYSSYSYSSYNYIPPSGQKEQIWNSYGLRSWIRTDASLARIENLKQACASVTSVGGNIWMSGAGDYNSQDFGMPDDAKCRAWTPGSQSSYSYSSYPTYSSCTTAMVSLLGSGCHFMYNDSSNIAVYCNGEMTKSAKLGDTAAKDGCQSGGGYSSYSYSSYPSSAYSSYSYSSYNYPQCDWSTQYLKNSTQTCVSRTNCYDTANADYNSSECQGVRGYTSYSSYSSYSSYPSSAYSSYSYSSYDASASCTQYGGTWNGSYCQYGSSSSSYSPASSAAYSSYDASSACSQAGGSWNGTSCVMPNTVSSAATYSSASADPSVACSQAGGSWNGTSCVMPSAASSAATYSSVVADPSVTCSQAGGSWNGTSCVMPGATTFNNGGGGLVASLGEALKGILRIFSK